ncbi:MAG: flagellar hook protein FlgE [Microbacteriaceae bacterium]|nr:flagellar hook protein FlgE [Burkholderiaceae bacterium]
MSFQQGVSGLTASARNLEVIGNNVANASTVGAKVARAEFADVYARAVSGGASAIGLGVSQTAVTQQFSQGSFRSTDGPLDMAINGGGFFQLKDLTGNSQYTRNGQFKVDRDGYVVNAQSARLLGYPANDRGVLVPGQAQPLMMPTAGIKPSTTANVTLELNLDARAAATYNATATPAINFNDAKTYNNATSVNVFDSKGQEVSLTYFFQKSAADTWNVYAAANGLAVNPDGNGVAQPISSITFPTNGSAPVNQTDPSLPLGPVAFDVPATSNLQGAATEPISGVKLDMATLTQYGAVFGVTNVTQDGFPPGQLNAIKVQPNGIVLATYSSGQSTPIGQVELATFRNVQGLQPLGGNVWGATYESGDPVPGTPGAGNLGVLQAGVVEESNIDLTAELVSMMVAQRIYQANAQTIKTQDSVLQTLVNLR